MTHEKDQPDVLINSFKDSLKLLWYRKSVCRRSNSKVKVNGSYFKATKYRALEKGYLTGQYEPYDIAFALQLAPKTPYIVDVGANIGLFVIPLLKQTRAQRALAIEPSHREIKQLRENIHLNDIHSYKLITAECGCSNQNELTDLNISDQRHCGSNSILDFHYSDTPLEDIKTVRLYPLDDMLKVSTTKMLFPRVDILKIDVEGYEQQVLEGAEETLLEYNLIIIIEYPKPETVQYLTSFGYKDITPKETRNNFFVKDPEKWTSLKS